MSIWHPGSGISYEQYLQANSFVKDITGQVMVSSSSIEARVSEQTKELVASNQQLANIFGESFNALSDSLEWGFNQINYALQDVSHEIESLHSDFNYNMALLIDEVRVNNKLFTDMISKLDAIHKTLESPILTQAREYYHIGCERLSKGLLDKALEAFLEAQKKNDTDFFIQFHIGKLYLYGIDEDDNVLNLIEAKKHLLLAARYAKAEISIDSNFSKFAAEALLHASISVYAQLGEEGIKDDADKTKLLLQEAKKLSSDAIRLCQDIPESFYHLAKYTSLLSDSESSIPNLETAIISDRNYAVKVDIDHAFDPIRPNVHKLLISLKEKKKNECKTKLNQTIKLLKEAEEWHPEEHTKKNIQLKKCIEELSLALNSLDSQTYFWFLDSIAIIDALIVLLPQLKNKCIKEFSYQVRALISQSKYILPPKGKYSLEVENNIDEVINLITTSEKQLDLESYASFTSALTHAKSANLKALSSQKLAREEDEEERRRERERVENERRQVRRNKASGDYAINGAWTCGLIGSLAGCVSCVQKGDFNLFGGAILGAVIGALLGAVFGQMKD